MKFGPVVQNEMSLKEKVYGRRHNRQRRITTAHLEPSAKKLILKKQQMTKHGKLLSMQS